MATARHSNNGLRKICNCSRRRWAKCPHDWHFNFKPRGGRAWRFSLDVELGRRLKNKEEAKTEAENIRIAIRAGTFVRASERPQTAAAATTPAVITLEAFRGIYADRRTPPLSANDAGCLRQFVAFGDMGTKAIGAITADDLDVFFTHLLTDGRAASTRNKYVQAIKAMFRWAVKKGYLPRDPVDAETIKREKHAQRNRRLVPDALDDKGKIERDGEERRLLTVTGPHLQRLIIAALETGMRRGELLNLQWREVNLDRKEITVRAETTKTRTGRVLPVSSRLAAVLEMARTAVLTFLKTTEPPNGRSEDETAALLARCYVFGDGAGLKVQNVKRAWETAVLKAHGYIPEWTPTNRLTASSRATLDLIDLHFHDLWHEAGSRLLEAGWPLHHVQEMLGHANVSQTSTYLNATRIGLHESMRRFEDGRSTPAASSRPDSAAPLETNAKSATLVN